MHTGNRASTDVPMDVGELAEYVLFVGTAEWTHDQKEQEEDDDLYVEVSVDATRQVHRTVSVKTAHCWDQDLKITGRLKSTVSIEIKSGANISPKNLSIARAVSSLENLLEICTDGDLAALELTIAPLVTATIDQATMADGLKGSGHFATGSIGFITVNLSRAPHTPPSHLQPPGIYTDPIQQTGEREERITAVEMAPPPQDSKTDSPVASLQQSNQSSAENLVSANALTTGWDKCSNFLLFGAREDNYDLFVEVKVNGTNEVHRTMHTKTAHWDEDIKITGCLSSIVRIEIKSVAHNSPESLSVVRVETSLEHLLEVCADGDAAVLGLAISRLVSGEVDPAAGTGGRTGSKYSASDIIGLMSVKLRRLSHEPPNILKLRRIPTVSGPQMSQLKRGIPEEVEERGGIDSDISAIADNISSIGVSSLMRFQQLGDLADLENAVANLQQAVALTRDGHPDKAARLKNVGISYDLRFERFGDLADLEKSVASLQQAVALTPAGDPRKAVRLTNLGVSYGTRFKRFGDLADLENSVASLQQAVALTPNGHPQKADFLTNVGTGYRTRFDRLGGLADLENSVTSLQQAVALTPDGHPNKPIYLANLGTGYGARFERLGDLTDLENSVASRQQAVALTPDGHPDKPGYLTNLGNGYSTRFERLGDLTDLDNSVANLQQAVALTPDGHPQKAVRLTNIGASYSTRFDRLGDLADLENSVASQQQAVTLTPDGHPKKATILSNLGRGYEMRFMRLGDLSDLENAVASGQQAVALTPDGHPQKAIILSTLAISYSTRFERLGDLTDLENSVANYKQAVALTPDDHPQKAAFLITSRASSKQSH
ncbi:hypothetical protein FIBSPDRAFT_2784 [Athelia psychrophila]|uniref:C2 domain-containing protein n=1 Tax=Athelia psychrophila TaxID=1759441 RepID=A0A166WYV5_9AGAM|nr:hypothetical protein FIBSPDRAFT_2784 [Fibularhizoctonia sp. CBS 109695]